MLPTNRASEHEPFCGGKARAKVWRGPGCISKQLVSTSESTIPEQTQPAGLRTWASLLALAGSPLPSCRPHLLSARPSVAHRAPISSVISTSSGLSAFEQLPWEGVSGGLCDLRDPGPGQVQAGRGARPQGPWESPCIYRCPLAPTGMVPPGPPPPLRAVDPTEESLRDWSRAAGRQRSPRWDRASPSKPWGHVSVPTSTSSPALLMQGPLAV